MSSGKQDPEPEDRGKPTTRRKFLQTVGLGALAVGGFSWLGHRLTARSPVAQQVGNSPTRGNNHTVVLVRHRKAIGNNGAIDGKAVTEMVEAGMTKLTGCPDAKTAWKAFFKSEDVVAIKVNCLGAPELNSHPQVVVPIVKGLRSLGIPEERIIIYDRLTSELATAGFPVNTNGSGVRCYGSDVSGYDSEPTEAGTVGACFSLIVSQLCTAIINVPLLRDHDLAGVTISLKNHFGSINNPNKLHEHRCTPQVADVNLAPQIRNKQRLIICDALLVTYDGGPALKPNTSVPYGGILLSTDPVALDAVGWEIIEGLRRQNNLPSLAKEGREPKYIAVAADANHRLGISDLTKIPRQEISLG